MVGVLLVSLREHLISKFYHLTVARAQFRRFQEHVFMYGNDNVRLHSQKAEGPLIQKTF